jgi:hypothetical protein
MKKLFSTTLLLAFALFLANSSALRADSFEILYASTGQSSAWLQIGANEEASIMSFVGAYANVTVLKYKDNDTGETTIASGTTWHSSDALSIPGPCEIKVQSGSGSSSYKTTALVKIKTAVTISTTAKYATVIPENAQTNVDVVLEQSTDLVNWTSVAPGQFAPSAQKRFFRLRSANVPVAVTGATNASPIVVTSTGHALDTGDAISISGVAGNTAANGTFTVTKVDANTFSLNGSTGNAAYTSGGTWLPSP